MESQQNLEVLGLPGREKTPGRNGKNQHAETDLEIFHPSATGNQEKYPQSFQCHRKYHRYPHKT